MTTEAATLALDMYYQKLCSIPASKLSASELIDLEYFEIERLILAGVEPELALTKATWIRRVHQVEAFVKEHERLPNSSKTTRQAGNVEIELSIWLRNQRHMLREAGSHDFKKLRLSCIPGLRWSKRTQSWHGRLREALDFIEAKNRPPAARSRDPRERAIAHWIAKQRWLDNAGDLRPDRSKSVQLLNEALESLKRQ